MIRVTKVFTCNHGKPGQPVEEKSQGHSYSASGRFCLCTGKPVKMLCEVKFHDPDPALS